MPGMLASPDRPVRVAKALLHLSCLLVPLDRRLMSG
jgi:hypothetical protein